MINWDNYFSNIYILTRALNIDRRKILDEELYRIGLTKYHYWYNCTNELIDYNKVIDIYGKGPQRVLFGHYTLIKTCYELGYENVLIMEDDNRFLKDINDIKDQLDIFLKNKNNINIYYFDYLINYDLITYNNCYYIDRKAMKYLIYCFEHFTLTNDLYILKYFLYPNNHVDMTYIWYHDENGNKIEKIINIDKSLNLLPIQVMLAQSRICVQPDKINKYFNQSDQYKINDINKYNLLKK